MELLIDEDVRLVAEFMQSSLPASKLVSVAEGIRHLAPLLWGQHEKENVSILLLRGAPIR
jgi:hypothetical protein